MALYPNPVSDALFIKTANQEILQNIEIFDHSGKNISSARSVNQINFHTYSSDLYLVRFTDSNGVIKIKKVVKRQKSDLSQLFLLN